MISRKLRRGAALLAVMLPLLARAEAPPTAAFARIPAMSHVVISPDGAQIAYFTGFDGRPALVVADLDSKAPARGILKSPPDPELRWCRYKTPTRILCGYVGAMSTTGPWYGYTRLLALDSDGGKQRVLIANSPFRGAQLQDSIIDWLPESASRVLLELPDSNSQWPGVQELDVNDGSLHFRLSSKPPLRNFIADRAGDIRLGCGYQGTQVTCATRAKGAVAWTPLLRYEAFAQGRTDVLEPIAFGTDPDIVYARGDFEGRDALWRIDLGDKAQPQVEFVHPAVDIGRAIIDTDGRLLGVEYITDRPQLYPLDADYAAEIQGLSKAIPEHFLRVASRSKDGSRHIVAAYSDVDGGSYYLFDRKSHGLHLIGREYPELPAAQLARTRTIEYPARDGTKIPGYLTVPPGVRGEHLPLVVLPHGGPIARDTWLFDFLVQFLASRGYAVLQMNFRGSWGYGRDWFYAAHQDWGGLTYSDISDATRWAASSGLADPARICIVGWSFGGYAALLGATRDSALYRCAVSIAGVSSLVDLESENQMFARSELVRAQIGTDRDKLQQDSPLKHAGDVAIPILLVHGTHDIQVYVEQSKRMASALKFAKKTHELLLLEGEGHALSGERARVQLLEALERFLRQNLGAGVVSPPT